MDPASISLPRTTPAPRTWLYAQLLRQVYGDATAQTLAKQIAGQVRQAAPQGRCAPHRFSEEDVMLISYADTLLDGDTPPLKVLRRFYQNRLKELVSMVHVLPFFPSTSDDGFAVSDYRQVCQELGSWDDIEALARDCALMVDAVINHVSQSSAWFQGYLAGDPACADFFISCPASADLSKVVRPRPQPVLARFEDSQGQERLVWATFSRDQLDLNYANPRVLLAVMDVLLEYVRHGARLIRLDAVAYLWKEPGTDCIHRPQTHALIKLIRAVLEDAAADMLIVTETNVPHEDNIAYFGKGDDEAHMVYNFALPPLIAYAILSGNARVLSGWAQGLELPSAQTCFLNFTASHDGIGLRAVEGILSDAERTMLADTVQAHGGFVSYRAGGQGTKAVYELNCSYADLLSAPGDSDALRLARMLAAQAIMLAMPGVPALYIHSLLGSRNDLQRLRDHGHKRAINRSQLDIGDLEAALADTSSFRGQLFAALAHMLRVRRATPAFHPAGAFQVLALEPGVFAIKRHSLDGQSMVLALVSVSANCQDLDTGLAGTARDLLGGETVNLAAVPLAPYGIRWLDIPAA